MRPEELHERRAQAGITIRRLSDLSGVSESTIGRIEHGYRGARERTLRQLEQALDESAGLEKAVIDAARRYVRLKDEEYRASSQPGDPRRSDAAYEALREALRRLEERA